MNRIRISERWTAAVAAAVLLLGAGRSAEGQVRLVNVIPAGLSGERNQDSETTVAVRKSTPTHLALASLSPKDGDCGDDRAHIFASEDGGLTWGLSCIIPAPSGKYRTSTRDITIQFGDQSGQLYAALVLQSREDESPLNVLRTRDFRLPEVMTPIAPSRFKVDQPSITVATHVGPGGAPVDRVLVGLNDFALAPRTAAVDIIEDGAAAVPDVSQVQLEGRSTGNARQNGPAVRVAVADDGTSYAAYYGFRRKSFVLPVELTTDVVVARSDPGSIAFGDLRDPADGGRGIRVATDRVVPWGAALLGQERLYASTIAVAVSPTNSNVVYVAWGDRTGGTFTLHVRRSDDRGARWTEHDVRVVPNATNPSLAVNDRGTVGLLYQQLESGAAGSRWVTVFESSQDAFATPPGRVVLVTSQADDPLLDEPPYLGDYTTLRSAGTAFVGAFAASNFPDLSNFPNGVLYQRRVDFAARRLLDVDGKTPVPVSIDPFVFVVQDPVPP